MRKERNVVRCPECGGKNCSVVESRERENGSVKMRRRRCEECGEIFKTFEILAKKEKPLYVKQQGRNNPIKFNREKLKASIVDAAYDSSIPIREINQFLNSIEFDKKRNYSVDGIFEATCEFLKKKDYKAYIRYAVSRKEFVEKTETSVKTTPESTEEQL